MSDVQAAPRSVWQNLMFAGASGASAGLLLVLFVIAGRTLGDVEFGKFSFALALGTIFETLMDFGLHQVTIREVARDRSRATSVLHHTLGIKLLWTTGGLAALLVTATFLRPEWDVRIACYLVGGALVARSFMFTIRGVLQGLERFGWDSIVVLGDRGLLLILGVIALVAGYGLLGLAAAFVVARGGALVLGAWLTQAQLGGVRVRYDRDVWRELQKSAVPFGLFLIVLNLYSYVDSVMLGVMKGDVETGIYGAAYKVYEGVGYLPGVLASVLTPRLSSLYMTDRAAHKRLVFSALGGSMALALLVTAVGFVFAEPVVTLLFGQGYAPAAQPFRILCVGLVLVFAIWTLHATAISANKEKLLVRAALIGLVVNVAANAYAIPHYGATGAAAATVIGELVSLAVLIVGLL
jgi:O-antigen/teichoic acid export membrane protein